MAPSNQILNFRKWTLSKKLDWHIWSGLQNMLRTKSSTIHEIGFCCWGLRCSSRFYRYRTSWFHDTMKWEASYLLWKKQRKLWVLSQVKQWFHTLFILGIQIKCRNWRSKLGTNTWHPRFSLIWREHEILQLFLLFQRSSQRQCIGIVQLEEQCN